MIVRHVTCHGMLCKVMARKKIKFDPCIASIASWSCNGFELRLEWGYERGIIRFSGMIEEATKNKLRSAVCVYSATWYCHCVVSLRLIEYVTVLCTSVVTCD